MQLLNWIEFQFVNLGVDFLPISLQFMICCPKVLNFQIETPLPIYTITWSILTLFWNTRRCTLHSVQYYYKCCQLSNTSPRSPHSNSDMYYIIFTTTSNYTPQKILPSHPPEQSSSHQTHHPDSPSPPVTKVPLYTHSIHTNLPTFHHPMLPIL